MADIIRQDDKVARGVENLTRAEQFGGELGLKELFPGTAGPVQYHNGIGDISLLVAVRRAEACIMDFEFG